MKKYSEIFFKLVEVFLKNFTIFVQVYLRKNPRKKTQKMKWRPRKWFLKNSPFLVRGSLRNIFKNVVKDPQFCPGKSSFFMPRNPCTKHRFLKIEDYYFFREKIQDFHISKHEISPNSLSRKFLIIIIRQSLSPKSLKS